MGNAVIKLGGKAPVGSLVRWTLSTVGQLLISELVDEVRKKWQSTAHNISEEDKRALGGQNSCVCEWNDGTRKTVPAATPPEKKQILISVPAHATARISVSGRPRVVLKRR